MQPIRRCPARAAIARPAASLPVNDILATRGWSTSASPAARPPVTTLITPGGMPAFSASRASSIADAEVTSDGLMTTVLPAASAGATVMMVRKVGEFHGTMAATTPSGSLNGVVEDAGAVERDHPALDLVGQAAEIIQPVLHDARLGAHFGKQLAVLLGFHRRDLFGVFGDQVAPAHHQPAAPGRRQRPPGPVECRVRGAHGGIDIAGAGFDETAQRRRRSSD